MKTLICVSAIATLLCACATTESSDDGTASVKNALYVVGDSSTPVEALTGDEANGDGETMPKRLYWFFAGR